MHYPPIYRHHPPTVDPTYGMKAVKITQSPILKADWIWSKQVSDNQYVTLRGRFNLKHTPRTATCYVTADNFFTLYVNGKKVGESVPDPKNDSVWEIVHHYQIHSLLKPGVNTVTVVGNNTAGAAGVLLAITSGNKTLITTNPNWKVTQGTIQQGASAQTIWEQAVSEGDEMTSPWNGNLQGWPGIAATYLKRKSFNPVGFINSQGVSVRSLRGGRVEVTPGATPSSTLVDFGEEVAGRIQITAPPGEHVSVGTGESEGEALHGPWGGVHTFTARKGVPMETPWSAFRYAKVTFSGGTNKPYQADILTQLKYYPVQYLGAFRSSSSLLNKIWYTGAYTAHLCMQEDIWDAPKRDRARWMGDLQVSGRVIDDVFLDHFLMEQTMARLRADAQGNRPPMENPVSHVNGIPGYSAAWVVGLADFTKRVGDMKYLKSQHDLLISMLRYMRTDLNSDNLYSDLTGGWSYTDWSPGFSTYDSLTRTATQMYYIKAFKDAAFMFNAMHDDVNAAKSKMWAQKLTDAAQKYLIDDDTKTFSDRRQDNAMAVFADATTPEENSAIYQRDFQPDSPAWNQTATPYYNNYVLFAMSGMGHTPAALKFAKDYWGGMIKEGATTFWEGYDLSWPKVHPHKYLQADNLTGYYVSLCHGWSSGVTAWLTERILGVESEGVGYAQTNISPNLCDLSWVKGNVPTPHGLIQVDVKKMGNRDVGYAILPEGVTAKLTLNGKSKTVSGPGRFELP